MTTPSTKDQADRTPDDILHPDNRQLFRYWESIRGEQSAPSKSDIDLKKISRLLPYLGILERHPLRQLYHWRLAGTGICKLFNSRLTGEQFMSDWQAFESSVVSRMLDSVISSHQPSIARIKASNSQGDSIGLELLALPYATSKPNITHLLVGIVMFREPSWLGQQEITGIELSKVKMICTEHASSHSASGAAISLSPAQAGDINQPLFRVIEGGLTE